MRRVFAGCSRRNSRRRGRGILQRAYQGNSAPLPMLIVDELKLGLTKHEAAVAALTKGPGVLP